MMDFIHPAQQLAHQDNSHALSLTGFFLAIASALEEGNEPIAHTAAEAMRHHAPFATVCVPPARNIDARFLPGLLRPGAHPIATHLHDVFDHLNWRQSGSENGRIRSDLSTQMLTCELIGPTGIVFDPVCRVGLFAQSSNLDYPERSHPAEELFVMLSGTAMWRLDSGQEVSKLAGERVHHPSCVRHASRTVSEPLIAIWAWTGDIDFDKYELHG
ncbi:MAG: dimethylsulfonioproprionate lyase family protein [Rhizobiaceae bacterium]